MGSKIKTPSDLLKRGLKIYYSEFIQYIFSSLECKYENDDDVLE